MTPTEPRSVALLRSSTPRGTARSPRAQNRRARARLALCLVLALLGGARALASEPPTVDEIRAKIAAGATAEALAIAQLGLEYQPEDPSMLVAAVDAARAAGQVDEAIRLAVVGLGLEGLAETDRAQFEKRLAELDPRPGARQALLDAYAARMLALAKAFERRKLYANAVDLLTRCAGTSSAAAADKLLDKVYGNPKAVAALLDSGVDVPVEPKKAKKTPQEIARLDAKHASFDDCYEVETENYTIKTNMGYEMAHAVATAMEQMGQFYRKVFRHKERGGTMRRCVIHIYSERLEFDQFEADLVDSPYVRGFFAPLENRVAAYDRRTDGGTIGDLWSTLFHEASHQFTAAVSKNLIPGWLNEGTASYFEGARLTPNGRVETNLVPESRLIALYRSMGHGQGSKSRASVRLQDVVAYYRPGSYDGEYYPWGWGIVYFIHNYENERSERIYVEPYSQYWAAYSGGGNHDVVGRFVEHFVTGPAVPGVDNIDKFEAHFARWIAELYELHFGGAEQADKLVARGRKQAENGKPAYAAESFRWALRKRPDDLAATYGLAVAYHEQALADAALFHLRRSIELSRAELDEAAKVSGFGDLTVAGLVSDARARMVKLNEELSAGVDDSAGAFEREIVALAEAYAGDEYPRAALALLDRTEAMFGATASMMRTADGIREKHGLEESQWRRLRVDPGLELWDTIGAWSTEGWTLVSKGAKQRSLAVSSTRLGAEWRVEVDVSFSATGDEGGAAGLLYGVTPDGGLRHLALTSKGSVVFIVLEGEEEPKVTPVAAFEFEPDRTYHLALEARGDELELFLDGESVAQKTVRVQELTGQIGVFQQEADARFGNLRVRE